MPDGPGMHQHGSCIKHGWQGLLELNLVTGIHPGNIPVSGAILLSVNLITLFSGTSLYLRY